MKTHSISRTMVLFFLVALALIGFGLLWGIQVFSHFEYLAQSHESHEALLDGVRTTAFYAVICGSMVVSGIGILVLELLHMGRRAGRIQMEAEALRRKNEEMEAILQKNRELAHLQRLQTIGALTSSIAHEFNNLLTPIMGYSMMALEQLEPEQEELYDEILEIYNASRKAKTIISRLSDLSRKNTDLTFRPLSPDEVVRKTLDVAKPAKPSRVEVQLDLNCWDQRIRANEIQVSQLLLNLILNSFHAMEASGGVLTVRTAFDEDNIRIQVADTGSGIPEEIRGKIFEPFFTTKESGKGTGLGLAIAAQVVADHKGRIELESQPGKGTTFTVSLPRTAKG